MIVILGVMIRIAVGATLALAIAGVAALNIHRVIPPTFAPIDNNCIRC
jgi:hypothetical protein